MTEDARRLIVLGIDPGLKGAIAVICDGKARVEDTPVANGAYLTASMVDLVRDFTGVDLVRDFTDGAAGARVVAALEDGIAMPKQSSRSTATAFRGIGIWHGVLAGLGIPFEYVRPNQWTKELGLTKASKGEHIAKAQQLFAFPSFTPHIPAGKDGRADALLIAEWRRRQERS